MLTNKTRLNAKEIFFFILFSSKEDRFEMIGILFRYAFFPEFTLFPIENILWIYAMISFTI